MKALLNVMAQVTMVLVLLVGAAGQVLALGVPTLTGRVNDTAHILSPASVRLVEQSLQDLEQTDSTQIVVLTLPSLEGEALEPYALKVVERWKIGQQGVDNGALLLIAINDRKIRIETGYGLEGRLTDLVAGRIIREQIAPAFKRGDYDQGVINGVAAMVAAVRGEYIGKGRTESPRQQQDPGAFMVALIVGLTVIGKIFRRRKPVAAGLGAVFAFLLAAVVFSGLFSALVLALLVPVGLVGALLAGVMDGTRGGRSSGGFFPGSGSGGGSGGGFSGGGGSFGGGGASGGW